MAGPEVAPQDSSRDFVEPTILLDAYVLDRAITRLLTVAMEPSALSPHDYALCGEIRSGRAVTTTALATRFETPLTTMSDWVRDMARRDLLAQSKSPTDRRSSILTLTAVGDAAYDEAAGLFGRAYESFVRHTTTTTAQQRAILTDLIDAALAARQDLVDE